MKEVLTRLDALAAKLNTTGEHLWQVLIKQAGVEAIKDSLAVVICAGIIFFSIRTAISLYRKAVATRDDGTEIGCTVGSVICIVFAGTMLLVGTTSLLDLPTELLNPEYWALRTVLSALGGK